MRKRVSVCLHHKMMKTIATCLRYASRRSFNEMKTQAKYCHRVSNAENMAKEHEKVIPLYQNSEDSEWKSAIEAACASLKSSHIIAVPTDTIYGIAGLAQSTSAVKTLYSIKRRDASKPIAICVGDVEDVGKWGKVTISQELLSRLLPGPVTVVLERTVALNPSLNPGTSLVGIRVPDYGFIRSLARECEEPLALTSANVSNGTSTVGIQEFAELWPALDLVFDGGTLGTCAQSRLGSTVVDLSKPGFYTIIRDGSAYSSTVETLRKFGLVEEVKS